MLSQIKERGAMERGIQSSSYGPGRKMADEDYSMTEEDSVMVTTELNGDTALDTVGLSNLSRRLEDSSPGKKDRLPFHVPFKGSSFSQANGTPKFKTPSSSRPANSPDKMDFTMSTSGRVSPEVRVAPKPKSSVLPYASSKTGLVYDARMRFHAEPPNMTLNADDIHPEDPRRIHSIFEEIRQAGLVGSSSIPEDDSEDHCWRISIRHATRPEILLIHTEEHYAFVKSLGSKLYHKRPSDFN
jgi:histone deacetylase 6